MNRSAFPIFLVLLFLLGLVPQASGQDQRSLADKVKVAIDKGVKYLRGGNWENNLTGISFKGGGTSLAVLAMLNCGVPANDPDVRRGLEYLRKLEPEKTYVRALQTLVFVEAGQIEDLGRIKENVDWLVQARVLDGNKLKGWSYDKGARLTTDNSNTQYALLGLWAGRQAGIDLSKDLWESIRDFYIRIQNQDGGFPYAPEVRQFGGSTLSMTTAGICGLLIAGMELNQGREILQADGSAKNCGLYEENPAMANALRWLGGYEWLDIAGQKVKVPILDPTRNPRRKDYQAVFYNFYGLERAGRLSGLHYFGGHDWYREGCKIMVGENPHQNSPFKQHPDGSWRGPGIWDQWQVVSTSFALLFLSKGRTPVLVSKLVHGAWPRSDDDNDWNNDRNDLRNLVEFIRKEELFKKIPLAWQTFDIRSAADSEVIDEKIILDVTAELLQSPIAYINGHQSPFLRFGGLENTVEKSILKRYLENGGFLIVEACCNSKEFDQGFKALVKQLWPEHEFDYLPADHPVWTSHYKIEPGQPYKLMGLQMGCKTTLIYSPQDLSCQWEGNKKEDGRGKMAFRLGANIIAYATGLEPPRPRLSQVNLASSKDDPNLIPRGFLKVAQIKYGETWPAPGAMRNLMSFIHDLAGLDVVLKTEEMELGNKALVDFKFIYMHGRKGPEIKNKDELKYLRFNLENGGLLLADACCGKEAFDKAFRQFARALFPPDEPGPDGKFPYKQGLQLVPLDDPLYGEKLNGKGNALTGANIRARRQKGGPMENMPPYLEGIKLPNGRWALLYSKYDIGCALERHQASDCLGYHPDSAFRLAAAAVLYLYHLPEKK